MPVYTFNDKMGNRGRSCRYRILHDGNAYGQQAAEANKLAVFQSLQYEKNGKWSNTDWKVTTNSAKLLVCMAPFRGWSDTLEQCLEHIQDCSEGYTGYRPTEQEALCFLQSAYASVYADATEKEELMEELI